MKRNQVDVFGPIDKGVYTLRIVRVDVIQLQSMYGPTRGMNFEFEIVGGEFDGRGIWLVASLPRQIEVITRVIGLPGEDLRPWIEKASGVVVKGVIDYKNGRNIVKKLMDA